MKRHCKKMCGLCSTEEGSFLPSPSNDEAPKHCEYGGVVRQSGETWSPGPCVPKCECQNGFANCSKVECPDLNCDKPIKRKWKCCAECLPSPEKHTRCGVETHGGNAERLCCVFPFNYQGIDYFTCTSAASHQPWCSITRNYDRDELWGYCVDKSKIESNHTKQKDMEEKSALVLAKQLMGARKWRNSTHNQVTEALQGLASPLTPKMKEVLKDKGAEQTQMYAGGYYSQNNTADMGRQNSYGNSSNNTFGDSSMSWPVTSQSSSSMASSDNLLMTSSQDNVTNGVSPSSYEDLSNSTSNSTISLPVTSSATSPVTSSADSTVTSSADSPVTSSANSPVTPSADSSVTSSPDSRVTSSSDLPVTSSSDSPVTSSSNSSVTPSADSSVTSSPDSRVAPSFDSPVTSSSDSPVTSPNSSQMTSPPTSDESTTANYYQDQGSFQPSSPGSSDQAASAAFASSTPDRSYADRETSRGDWYGSSQQSSAADSSDNVVPNGIENQTSYEMNADASTAQYAGNQPST